MYQVVIKITKNNSKFKSTRIMEVKDYHTKTLETARLHMDFDVKKYVDQGFQFFKIHDVSKANTPKSSLRRWTHGVKSTNKDGSQYLRVEIDILKVNAI